MFNLYVLNEIYTNNFYSIFLNIISVFSVLCGVCVIIAKNPIVSVLFLIGLFFSVASYLIMLGLNFIGLSYLLVYVGAVSILFLFILMLINVRISELVTDNNNSFILAIMIGIFILIPINSKCISTSYPKGKIEGNEFNNTYVQTRDTEINSLHAIRDMSGEEKNLNTIGETSMINDLIKSTSENSYIIGKADNDIFFVTSKIWDGALEETSHITSIGNIIYTNYPIWLILTSMILLLAMVGAIVITIKQSKK